MTVQHDPRGVTDTLTFGYDGLNRRIQTVRDQPWHDQRGAMTRWGGG